MALVNDLNISLHYTDKLYIYKAFFSVDEHAVSKFKMQRIERLHLTFRTRIKRLSRKTICFSKCTDMHDLVIGIFINQYLFNVDLTST